MSRTVVVGLDGFHHDLISVERTPVLNELFETNPSSVLRSERPPMTSSAWATLLTGMGVANTGITSQEFDKIVERIVKATDELPNTEALRGSNIYQGKYSDRLPDVYIESDTYAVRRGLIGQAIETQRTDHHHRNGVLCCRGPIFNRPIEGCPSIADVMPLVLACVRGVVPRKCDGCVPLDVAKSVKTIEPLEPNIPDESVDRMDNELRDRLETLGYL